MLTNCNIHHDSHVCECVPVPPCSFALLSFAFLVAVDLFCLALYLHQSVTVRVDRFPFLQMRGHAVPPAQVIAAECELVEQRHT